MKKIFPFVALTLIVGCSSTPKSGVENAGSEKVLSRIDDLVSRPDWLRESEPFKISSGKVTSLGMTTIPADNNLSAAYRIAENNAKSAVSHTIEQRLEFIFQNAEEGTVMGASQAQYIGAEASKLTTNSLRPSKRYYEKVALTQENGQVTVQYRVYALVEMPEQDFKTAIVDAIKKSHGKQGISAEFAKKVNTHWDKFTESQPEQRQPSTTEQ